MGEDLASVIMYMSWYMATHFSCTMYSHCSNFSVQGNKSLPI